ncbi:DUF2484 family protein [Paracoccus lutimaris]|uniref:Uncharacterized protein DUF2484 n=1 Tax=Paracoccus lutimaris TaxID=1490030 RepID=A0A368YNI6_9RHOB|nr:DUF2484 family protein [Paracoccus lutimaris]RCW79714.1 uncharacterized protein DUF2484 [Paracoccus lutimaris]
MSLLATHPLLAVIAAVLWVAAACLMPFIRLRWRYVALWVLVICGVPVLGWLTYLGGPACGVLFLLLGLSLLVWPPVEALRRRRHHPQRGAH